MTNDQRNPENGLEWVVDELRESPVPAEPDDAFRQRLVNRLFASAPAPQSSGRPFQPRRITMRRVVILAASVLVVSAVIGWIASLNRTPAGSAFARMLEQVNNARTVVFSSRVEIGDPPVHRMQSQTMLLEPDWVREEITEGDDHMTVHIFNMRQRKTLTLTPATKNARLLTVDVQSSTQPKNMIEQIRRVRESSAEFLGREPIDGKDTLKYRYNHPTGYYLLWIAPSTDLPVKVVMSESGDKAKGYVTITLTDFQWNVPLDESLFTLVPPEGYTLEQEQRAMSALGPENFIETLRMYARLNNNQFPDEYNALTPGSMIKFLDDPSIPAEKRQAYRRQKLAQALDRPEMEKMSEEEWKKEGQENAKRFVGAAVFLQVLAQTHDWHYVGKGVKLGEADKVVAWWAPKDAADKPRMATVLYGDLHTETKPADGLPIEK